MPESRAVRVSLIIFISVALFYAVLRIFFYSTDPVLPFIAHVVSSYQAMAESVSNLILRWSGFPYRITGHLSLQGDIPVIPIESGLLLKKWFLILLLLIWITPLRAGKRVLLSLLLLAVNFIFASVDIALFASMSDPDLTSSMQMSRTPGVLAMVTFFVLFVMANKKILLERISMLRIDSAYAGSMLGSLFVVMYLYVILGNFVLGFFEFRPWVHFLFSSTQRLLHFMHTDSVLKGNLLIGENANLYMGKACLGMNTILLFAAVVYLTGRDHRSRWLFIAAGVVFINIMNIIRLTLLFRYVQQNSGYDLTMDVHDMYDYVIYSLIFVLWLVWFEVFLDIRNVRHPAQPGSP